MESTDIKSCSPPEYRVIKERFLANIQLNTDVVIIVIVFLYILLVAFGPRLMEKRRPMNLKRVIAAYNIAQIIYNGIMIQLYLRLGGFKGLLPWRQVCCPISYGVNHTIDDVTRAFFVALLYFINKNIDLVETGFFILKKNNRQITFLHVYHHVIMVVGSYYSLVKSNDEVFLSLAVYNCVVHFFMYFYYLMSAYDSMKPYLGWKRQLTRLQIAQFVNAFVLVIQFMLSKCSNDPTVYGFWGLVVLSFVVLFTRFYIQNYVNKTKK